jgi:hypothetical protein
MEYIIIAEFDENYRPTKINLKTTEVEAQQWLVENNTRYPDAFYAEHPKVATKWIVIDPQTKTITIDTAGFEAVELELLNNKYKKDRAEAYPSLTDQADMAYWDRQNGTTTLDDAISAVKAEFPKPV